MKLSRVSSFAALAAALALGQNSQEPTDKARSGAHSQQSGSQSQSTDQSKDGTARMDQGRSGSKNSGGSGDTLSRTDHTFVTKAAEGGRMEVELAQQALQKASRPEVKDFAQHLIDDHTQANNELMEIAGSKGMSGHKMSGSATSGSHASDAHGSRFYPAFSEFWGRCHGDRIVRLLYRPIWHIHGPLIDYVRRGQQANEQERRRL